MKNRDQGFRKTRRMEVDHRPLPFFILIPSRDCSSFFEFIPDGDEPQQSGSTLANTREMTA